MADQQRNAEIWSTRVQRELLALTTENDENKDVAGMLPTFITIKNHELDIPKGICKVSFDIVIPKPKKATTSSEPAADESQGGVADAASGDEDKKEEEPATEKDEGGSYTVVITLDASLKLKSDGNVDPSAIAYPFECPKAILVTGADYFPPGSTVKETNEVDIDCDWTPSLHLTDAITNIGLKVKESILQGEPFHPANATQSSADTLEDVLKGARNRMSSMGGMFAQSIKKLGAATEADGADKPKKKKRSLRKKKPGNKAAIGDIQIGDEINLMEAPWVDCKGLYSCKAIRRPELVHKAMAEAEQNTAKEVSNTSSSILDPTADDGEIPDDFSDYMLAQASSITKAAGASFAGAGSMFRSFTKQAKSLVEESFLMITDTHIIEMRSNKLNLSTGTITYSVSVELLAKLKFRRQESISLFFKPAPDDPLIYLCPDSADAVHQIQAVLKSRGVKGKHTNAATQRAINEALQLVQSIKAKEKELDSFPTVERVNEIMDLYRQAAERFESAGDIRHEEVVTHLRKFLALPLTTSILDGTYVKSDEDQMASATTNKLETTETAIESKNDQTAVPSTPVVATPPKPVPEGEVLETSPALLDEYDDDGITSTQERKKDDDFNSNMDQTIEQVKKDLDSLNTGEDDLDALLGGDDAGVSPDTMADLDEMFSAADKELADIMNS